MDNVGFTSGETGRRRGGSGLEIAITVCYAQAGQIWLRHLRLAVGSTVTHALAASAFTQAFPEHDPWQFGVGVFNQAVAPDYVLQAGDRVEIYRPLKFDPMELRRRRAARRRGVKNA